MATSSRPTSTASGTSHAEDAGIELHRVSSTANQSTVSSSTAFPPAQATDADPPEGGYGWTVLFGCSTITFLFVGITYCWGILQAPLVASGLASTSTLSFVGSLTVACVAGFALVNARLITVLGARKMGLLGVSLLAVGQILSGWTKGSTGGLFVTAGFVAGVGTSLCFMTVSTIPGQYFSKRRGLANGIVYAGGGLGGTVFSFTMDSLVQKLGVAWTFRCLGLITFAIGLPAAYVVVERYPIRRSVGFVDWHLFKSFTFTSLFLAGAIGTFPLFVPPFFLPLYAESLGLSSSAGAGLVGGFNFASAVGRLGFGFFADAVGPVNALLVALSMSAVSMLAVWPASTSIGPLIVFVIINGAANGGFFSLMPSVVGSIYGPTRQALCMGMIVSGWVGGYLMGAPIAGYLLDAYGGEGSGLKAYRPAIFYAGSMGVGAAGLVGAMRWRMGGGVGKKV